MLRGKGETARHTCLEHVIHSVHTAGDDISIAASYQPWGCPAEAFCQLVWLLWRSLPTEVAPLAATPS